MLAICLFFGLERRKGDSAFFNIWNKKKSFLSLIQVVNLVGRKYLDSFWLLDFQLFIVAYRMCLPIRKLGLHFNFYIDHSKHVTPKSNGNDCKRYNVGMIQNSSTNLRAQENYISFHSLSCGEQSNINFVGTWPTFKKKLSSSMKKGLIQAS